METEKQKTQIALWREQAQAKGKKILYEDTDSIFIEDCSMQKVKTERELLLEKKVEIAEKNLKTISEFKETVIDVPGYGGVYIGALAKDIAFITLSQMEKIKC